MAKHISLYGLKNCDGCRKAQRWFAARGVAVRFHDIRDPQHTAAALAHLQASDDWESFVNRRSTTWRQLPNTSKTDLSKASALALCAEHPALIKRPLLVIGTAVLAGFDERRVEQALA